MACPGPTEEDGDEHHEGEEVAPADDAVEQSELAKKPIVDTVDLVPKEAANLQSRVDAVEQNVRLAQVEPELLMLSTKPAHEAEVDDGARNEQREERDCGQYLG